MKIIEYSTKGIAVADLHAEDVAREFLANDLETLVVSTENVLLAARALVAEHVFPYDQLVFRHEDLTIKLEKTGAIHHWPLGFCDASQNFLFRILDARFKK